MTLRTALKWCVTIISIAIILGGIWLCALFTAWELIEYKSYPNQPAQEPQQATSFDV